MVPNPSDCAASRKFADVDPAVDGSVHAEVGFGRDHRYRGRAEEPEVLKSLNGRGDAIPLGDSDTLVQLPRALAPPGEKLSGVGGREIEVRLGLVCPGVFDELSPQRLESAAPSTTVRCHGCVLHHDALR